MGYLRLLENKIFSISCSPSNPMESCMVSSKGACSAYFKYGDIG